MGTDDYAYGSSAAHSGEQRKLLTHGQQKRGSSGWIHCFFLGRQQIILAIGILIALGPLCATAEVITLAANREYPTRIRVAGPDVVWAEAAVSFDGAASLLTMPATGGQMRMLAQMPRYPTDIKIVGDDVYWSTTAGSGTGNIGKVSLANGQPRVLTSANQPFNIAVDEGFVYWTEDIGGPDSTQGLRKVDRQGVATSLVTLYGYPTNMQLVGTDIYFFNSGGTVNSGGMDSARQLVKIDRSGGNVAVLLTLGTNEWVTDLAADSTHLYWTDRDTGTIKQMPLVGGAVKTLVTGLNQPYRLAIFASSAESVGAFPPTERVLGLS
jgi:hypothetical protein